MTRGLILIANGTEELEAVACIDILRRAGVITFVNIFTFKIGSFFFSMRIIRLASNHRLNGLNFLDKQNKSQPLFPVRSAVQVASGEDLVCVPRANFS